MKTIKIKSCRDCPLYEFDDIYLENNCYLIDEIITNNVYESINDNCPLKKEPIKLELEE